MPLRFLRESYNSYY